MSPTVVESSRVAHIRELVGVEGYPAAADSISDGAQFHHDDRSVRASHVRKIPLADDVDISVIARSTPGFSGADLANLVNEAALNAARMDFGKRS